MKDTIVYMKIDQNIQVQNMNVYIGDIATVYTEDEALKEALNHLVFKVIKEEKDVKLCCSVMKVVECIKKEYPTVEIINLGETDFLLTYVVPKKPNKVLEYGKAAFVGLIIFFGGAFSIMTFNEDASVVVIFDTLYELVMGVPKNSWSLLEIGYSAGVTIGIILFFNHFSKWRLSDDPTPIQIEMRKYEKDVNATILENSSREGNTIDVD